MDSTADYAFPLQNVRTQPLLYLKNPRVILKFICLLFSLIALGCAATGYHVANHSIFKDDFAASQFAVAVSLLAFLFSIASIFSEFFYERLSNLKRRRNLLLSEVACCGLFTFLNLVAFGYLAHNWANTSATWLTENNFENWQQRNARSLLFFLFVSIISWVGVTLLALIRFRKAGLGSLSTKLTHPDMVGGEPPRDATARLPVAPTGQYSQYPKNEFPSDYYADGDTDQYYPNTF